MTEQFDPKLVEQAARAIRESPLTLAATPEAFALAVLTAVADPLRAEGAKEVKRLDQFSLDAAFRNGLRTGEGKKARIRSNAEADARTAYQRGMIDGARQVAKVAEDAYDQYPMKILRVLGAVKQAVARIEGKKPIPNTKEQNIEFRKQWDERYEAGQKKRLPPRSPS